MNCSSRPNVIKIAPLFNFKCLFLRQQKYKVFVFCVQVLKSLFLIFINIDVKDNDDGPFGVIVHYLPKYINNIVIFFVLF